MGVSRVLLIVVRLHSPEYRPKEVEVGVCHSSGLDSRVVFCLFMSGLAKRMVFQLVVSGVS